MPEHDLKCEIQIPDYHIMPDGMDSTARQLEQELHQVGVKSIELQGKPAGAKSLDPVALSILVITLSPTILTKFLEFLHAWSLRREGQVIRLKIQSRYGTTMELEVPASMNKEDATEWVNSVYKSYENSTQRVRKRK